MPAERTVAAERPGAASPLRPPGGTATTPTAVPVAVLLAVLVVGLGATAAWGVSAALTAGYGFDRTDEGFYLLSYRWWDTELRTFTGVQYLYGPVFDLLGQDIAGLRLFRLLSVLAVHTAFAVAFLRWLRQLRPQAPATRLWEAAGAAVVVAAGGMAYSWLPLTPGYNDVSVLGALTAAALVLHAARQARTRGRVPWWVGVALGAVAVPLLLAKWSSSVLTLMVIAVVLLVVLVPLGSRAVASVLGWGLLGTAAALLAVHLALVPLTQALPPMREVTALVAAAANSPVQLLELYARSLLILLREVLVQHAALLVAAVVAVAVRGRRGEAAAVGVVAVALVLTAARLALSGGLQGGVTHLTDFTTSIAVLLAAGAVVAVGGLSHRLAAGGTRPGGSTVAVVAMLVAVPVTQAAGTGNPILWMAVNGFAAWAALLVAVATGPGQVSPGARVLMAGVLVGAVLVPAGVATDALWHHPYRTVGRTSASVPVDGVPALASLRLDPPAAAEYTALHAALEPYLEPAGRRVMAFDELAGVVLSLDGRSVGESWYSATDPGRTWAGIEAACADGPPWGDRLPVVLAGRELGDGDAAALAACGLDLDKDYAEPFVADGVPGLTIRVPVGEKLP